MRKSNCEGVEELAQGHKLLNRETGLNSKACITNYKT